MVNYLLVHFKFIVGNKINNSQVIGGRGRKVNYLVKL